MKNKSKVIYEKTIWLSIVILFFLLIFVFKGIKTTASQGSTTSEAVQTVNNFNPTISTPTLVRPNPNPTIANIGDNMDVRYNFKVTPGTAVYSEIKPSHIDEVVFLVDLSKNMQGQARSTYVQNGICNQVINNDIMKSNNLKVGIIGMGDSPILVRGTDERNQYNGKDYSNVNLLNINTQSSGNMNDIVQQRVKQAYGIITSNQNNCNTPNVMDSLVKADEILQDGTVNNKAIVLIVSQNFQYDESKLIALENKGYKIIIMDISYNKTINVAQDNLNKVFTVLNGYGDNNILGEYDNQGTYNYADDDCKKIEADLSNGIANKSYRLSNLKCNFDLGEGFLPVNNSTTINYSKTVNNSPTIISVEGYNLRSEASLGDNRYSLTIPNIIFKCDIIENPASDDPSKIKVKYTPQINDQDIADDGNVYVNFKVNFKQYTSDNPVVFGTRDTVNDINHNNFSYNDINQKIIDPVLINTPAVKGNTNISIIHGIYNGNKNGVQTIDDTNTNNTFAQGSVVTMAAKFEVTAQSQLQLNLVKNQTRTDQEQLTLIGTPKIYKIQSDGQLSQLGVMDSSNKYTVDGSNLGKIIVIYSVKLPVYSTKLPNGTKISYTNTMKVGEASKDANIQIGNDGLPDLF